MQYTHYKGTLLLTHPENGFTLQSSISSTPVAQLNCIDQTAVSLIFQDLQSLNLQLELSNNRNLASILDNEVY